MSGGVRSRFLPCMLTNFNWNEIGCLLPYMGFNPLALGYPGDPPNR